MQPIQLNISSMKRPWFYRGLTPLKIGLYNLEKTDKMPFLALKVRLNSIGSPFKSAKTCLAGWLVRTQAHRTWWKPDEHHAFNWQRVGVSKGGYKPPLPPKFKCDLKSAAVRSEVSFEVWNSQKWDKYPVLHGHFAFGSVFNTAVNDQKTPMASFLPLTRSSRGLGVSSKP